MPNCVIGIQRGDNLQLKEQIYQHILIIPTAKLIRYYQYNYKILTKNLLVTKHSTREPGMQRGSIILSFTSGELRMEKRGRRDICKYFLKDGIFS